MAFKDQTLTCRDCGSSFTWTSGEQEFYKTRGFDNPPSRCPECRKAHKAQMRGGMGRQMHTTTCANCGKEAQVPFKPSGDRPVYCADCFRARREQQSPAPAEAS